MRYLTLLQFIAGLKSVKQTRLPEFVANAASKQSWPFPL